MSWPLFELTDNVKITFLGITPTTPHSQMTLRGNDYRLKHCVKKVEPFLTLPSVFGN